MDNSDTRNYNGEDLLGDPGPGYYWELYCEDKWSPETHGCSPTHIPCHPAHVGYWCYKECGDLPPELSHIPRSRPPNPEAGETGREPWRSNSPHNAWCVDDDGIHVWDTTIKWETLKLDVCKVYDYDHGSHLCKSVYYNQRTRYEDIYAHKTCEDPNVDFPSCEDEYSYFSGVGEDGCLGVSTLNYEKANEVRAFCSLHGGTIETKYHVCVLFIRCKYDPTYVPSCPPGTVYNPETGLCEDGGGSGGDCYDIRPALMVRNPNFKDVTSIIRDDYILGTRHWELRDVYLDWSGNTRTNLGDVSYYGPLVIFDGVPCQGLWTETAVVGDVDYRYATTYESFVSFVHIDFTNANNDEKIWIYYSGSLVSYTEDDINEIFHLTDRKYSRVDNNIIEGIEAIDSTKELSSNNIFGVFSDGNIYIELDNVNAHNKVDYCDDLVNLTGPAVLDDLPCVTGDPDGPGDPDIIPECEVSGGCELPNMLELIPEILSDIVPPGYNDNFDTIDDSPLIEQNKGDIEIDVEDSITTCITMVKCE